MHSHQKRNVVSRQNPLARSGDDVIVIGAGPRGLSSAFFLQSRGLRVTVVERDAVGSGAARGNGGIIVANDCVPLPAPGMVADGLKALFSASSSFYVRPSHFPAWHLLTRFALQSTPARFKEATAKLDILKGRTMKLWELLRDNGIGDQVQETPFLFAFGDRAAARPHTASSINTRPRGTSAHRIHCSTVRNCARTNPH